MKTEYIWGLLILYSVCITTFLIGLSYSFEGIYKVMILLISFTTATQFLVFYNAYDIEKIKQMKKGGAE